jgi:hypothetical protein
MSLTIDEKKVIYADLDPSEGVVLNLETKNYYRLNETGQVIWRGLASGKPVDAIALELSQTFRVTPESAQADVDELLLLLEREKLIAIG